MPVAQCDAEPLRQASLRLVLQRSDVKLSAGLSLISTATETLYLRRKEFLHPAELVLYCSSIEELTSLEGVPPSRTGVCRELA